MPCKPNKTRNEQMISKFLYPYLSTIGPKTSEPARIPKGSSAASEPAVILSIENLAVTAGRIEPKEIKTIPKRSMPKHAALNTKDFL